MLGLNIKQAKLLFFDRDVVKAVDKQTRFVLNRFGASVRLIARRSIRSGGKKGKVSAPGKPPRSHVGLLKQFILYVYEPQRKAVVIGPALLSTKPQALNLGKTIPETLEHGGTIITSPRRGSRPARIEPRPFIAPAAAEGEKRLPGFWAESVKR